MDFLNKFKHGDDSEAQKPSEPTATTTTTHESDQVPRPDGEPHRDFLGKLIAGSGRHGSDDDDKAGSFLDKLTRKEAREKKAVELVKREAELRYELDRVAADKKHNEGFLDRLKERFDGDNSHEEAAPVPPPKASAAAEEEREPGFLDRLTGKDERLKKAAELDRREAELRAELDKVEHEKRENEGVLERLKARLDGDEDEQKNAKADDGDDKPSFLDKITGKAAEEERRRQEEANKSALDKMKDRLNEGMGGGRKAEKDEDFVDKAVDQFQEHILRQGDQSNESAWEQMKDDKIADMIRSQLNIKDKKGDK